ncbi:MAG: thioesterase family protein [bacterium]
MNDRIYNKAIDNLNTPERRVHNGFEYAVNIRVGYNQTDKMGYAHHSQYLVYYEYARLEYLRELGISYKEIEDNGIMMPVISAKLDFIQPAYYDDVLTISTNLKIDGAKLIFMSEIKNKQNELVNTGEIKVVFIDSVTRKPVKPIKSLVDKINNKKK